MLLCESLLAFLLAQTKFIGRKWRPKSGCKMVPAKKKKWKKKDFFGREAKLEKKQVTGVESPTKQYQ